MIKLCCLFGTVFVQLTAAQLIHYGMLNKPVGINYRNIAKGLPNSLAVPRNLGKGVPLTDQFMRTMPMTSKSIANSLANAQNVANYKPCNNNRNFANANLANLNKLNPSYVNINGDRKIANNVNGIFDDNLMNSATFRSKNVNENCVSNSGAPVIITSNIKDSKLNNYNSNIANGFNSNTPAINLINKGNPISVTNESSKKLRLRVSADNLEVRGTVSVSGRMPIQGAVNINGNLPTDGKASVNFGCGSPVA